MSNIIYADLPVLPLYLSILNRYWIVCVVFRFYVFFPLPPAPPSGMKDENMENEGFLLCWLVIFFLGVGFADFFGIFLCFAESAGYS